MGTDVCCWSRVKFFMHMSCLKNHDFCQMTNHILSCQQVCHRSKKTLLWQGQLLGCHHQPGVTLQLQPKQFQALENYIICHLLCLFHMIFDWESKLWFWNKQSFWENHANKNKVTNIIIIQLVSCTHTSWWCFLKEFKTKKCVEMNTIMIFIVIVSNS